MLFLFLCEYVVIIVCSGPEFMSDFGSRNAVRKLMNLISSNSE